MRFFGRTPARRSGVGASFAITVAAVAMTGCSAEFWKGRPDVERVEVSVAREVIAEGETAQANGVAYKKGNSVISSGKVKISYSTSDPTIATVNSESGVVTGVAPGKVAVIATAQGKTGTDSVEVRQADPASVVVTPSDIVQLSLGASQTITLDPRSNTGLTLPNRNAEFTSTDTRIATVSKTGALTARINGMVTGSTQIQAVIGSFTKLITVIVRPQPVKTVAALLQNGSQSLQVSENQQIMVTLRDSADRVLSPIGHNITYQSSDQTVATVTTAGVVTGLRKGNANITIVADNDVRLEFAVTVVDRKVAQVLFVNRNEIFRVRAPRGVTAQAVDSVPRVIDRVITYSSSDPAIIEVNAIGLATPKAVGSALIIARVDDKADTLRARVTPMPVGRVRVDPPTTTIDQGQTITYRATVFDSLNAEVTDRTVRWRSNNQSAAPIDPVTGVARAVAPGTYTISAFVENVTNAADINQPAELVILPTPIASISVAPEQVSVRVGATAAITVIIRDAAGRELLGRGGSLLVRPADPSVASVDVSATGIGVVRGLKAGTTTVSFQGLDAGLNPQGTPATITVTVTDR